MRIHIQLKEIMFQVNLDEVTSKFVSDFLLQIQLIIFLISYVKNWRRDCQCH